MTAKKKPKLPSEQIEGFLDWLDEVGRQYREAQDGKKHEDNRLQDLLHDVELARTADEKHKADAAMRSSRVERRRQKNRAMELEYVYSFFQEGTNRKVINGMRQLLGNQRKREEYLNGEKHYRRRVADESEAGSV